MARRKSEKQKLVERIRRKNERIQRLYASTNKSDEADGFFKNTATKIWCNHKDKK